MALATDIREQADHLVVQTRGEWDLGEMKALIDQIADEAAVRRRNNVLIDISEVRNPAPEMHRFELGEYAAVLFRGLKVAVVYRDEYINRFFEHTALNRGVHVKVFGSPAAALDWLLG